LLIRVTLLILFISNFLLAQSDFEHCISLLRTNGIEDIQDEIV